MSSSIPFLRVGSHSPSLPLIRGVGFEESGLGQVLKLTAVWF